VSEVDARQATACRAFVRLRAALRRAPQVPAMSLLDRLLADIRARGPLTVAEFMERALYDPADGYYATAAQRSGRAGDFYTSVDVGPLFGELLAEFVARRWQAWRSAAREGEPFALVEAGAGNGRLARDLLDALATDHPACYAAARLHLVERSAAARAQHVTTLGPHAARLASSGPGLPAGASGVLIANELLDAFPAHRVRMTPGGLREVLVGERDGHLALVDGPPASPALGAYFEALGLSLREGAIADISPAAVDWVRDAAASLARGAMLLIDYGHEAAELFAGHHAGGTLVSFSRHQLDPTPSGAAPDRPAWLEAPGTRDLTTHVDFTSVTRAAERGGWRRESLQEQSRLLIGLGLGDRLVHSTGPSTADLKRRLAAKALALPAGLGASHRALVLVK
jgi:SAM-dependent MidA family methyltransferase